MGRGRGARRHRADGVRWRREQQQQQPGSSSTASGAAKGKPLNIGISLSQSGDFSDPGQAAKRGYELWADTVNAKGGVLGRPVKLHIVDDASSPNQAVSNYQNLISRDKVDLTFGPFSTLLTAPSAAVANRFGYAFPEPAGGGPAVFKEKLPNVFFVQPAPTLNCGDPFVAYIASLPPDQRPKTGAYPSLDDPFAAPIVDRSRMQLEALGVKTVFKQIYPAETTDMTPIVQKYVAAKPDLVFGGTQSTDAYAQVKAMVQLKYSPKFVFFTNGANSPTEFPSKVGANNTEGIFSCGDWFPTSKAAGNAAFVKAYLAKYGGDPNSIDSGSAEAYAVGQVVEDVAAKTNERRQRDDHQDAAHGQLADGRGQPVVGRERGAEGQRRAPAVAERQARAGLPAVPGAGPAEVAEAAVGRLSECTC